MSDKPIKGIVNSRRANLGATEYKVRFAPPFEGLWTFTTASNVKSLDGQSGSFLATPLALPAPPARDLRVERAPATLLARAGARHRSRDSNATWATSCQR